MSIAVKSGLPSLGSTEGAVITKDDISVTEETSPSASAGEDLPRGKSAYEIAKENGFNGTETEWLASLKGEPGAPGAPGKDGENGKTPYVGDNGNWYIGTDDTGKPSRGAKGEPGQDGVTPTFSIESVETGEPGTDAEVTMTGDAPNHGLRFVIPRGDKGDKGGTDISLGLTSAAVGQIIKVKAIDESGKPTEWEAANMQSGGGHWETVLEKPFDTIDGNTLVNRSGTLCVNTTDDAEQDNTRPITSSGVHVICGNINALLQTI